MIYNVEAWLEIQNYQACGPSPILNERGAMLYGDLVGVLRLKPFFRIKCLFSIFGLINLIRRISGG